MKIILLSGKAEAGKTTAAQYISLKLSAENKTSAIIPYGQYVKDTAKMIYGWDGKKDEFGRYILQQWGTDIVRKKEPNFWVDTVKRLVSVAYDALDVVLIDDCRFPNEITCWDDFPADIYTIRIKRPGWENALTPEQRKHPSETSLDKWKFDYVISAKNKTKLYKKLDPIIDMIKGG